MAGASAWLLWCCLLLVSSRGGWGKKGKCEVCKDFVKAFEEGLKSTENSNYAGGDTSWEEEKLGAYANSEVRLVEILDGVCKNFECHRLLEDNEEHIERWWFKLRHKGKENLKMWLCHDHLDICCPENTYGPTCRACPGGVDDPCGDHGSCEGAEEKDGSGVCKCNTGYKGDLCQECGSAFYNDSFSCVACNRACKDRCTGGSAADCEECANGYERNEDNECKDIDECKEIGDELCDEGKYCFNTPGSHRCNDCDRSCKKACTGAGPARCVECGNGYYLSQYNVCKDRDECAEEEAECEGDTYCENTPGSYACKACHVACEGGCEGAGPGNCSECKNGFTMKDALCEDVNECEADNSPCDLESETCHNLIGSFSCKCKHGLVRMEGKCVARVTKTTEPKKKKKKKSKKGGKAGKRKRQQPDTAGTEGEARQKEGAEREGGSEREDERKEEGEKLNGAVGQRGEPERGGVEGGTRVTTEELENISPPESVSGTPAVDRPVEGSHEQPEKSHDQHDQSHDQSEDHPDQPHDTEEELHVHDHSKYQSKGSHDPSVSADPNVEDSHDEL